MHTDTPIPTAAVIQAQQLIKPQLYHLTLIAKKPLGAPDTYALMFAMGH